MSKRNVSRSSEQTDKTSGASGQCMQLDAPGVFYLCAVVCWGTGIKAKESRFCCRLSVSWLRGGGGAEDADQTAGHHGHNLSMKLWIFWGAAGNSFGFCSSPVHSDFSTPLLLDTLPVKIIQLLLPSLNSSLCTTFCIYRWIFTAA